MSLVGLSVLIALSVGLFVSGSAKIFGGRVAVDAAQALGMPRSPARVVVTLVTTFELALASAILLWPGSTLALACVVGLFGAFALVGGYTLYVGLSVECGCFGSVRRLRLGVAQLVAFPLTLISTVFVARNITHLDTADGAIVVAASATLAAGFLAAAAWKAARPVIDARRSLGDVQTHVLALRAPVP